MRGAQRTKQSHNKLTIITKHGGYNYIITNRYNTVLYTSVTSELKATIHEHKKKFYPESFTAKFNCYKLVWYQTFSRIEEAIEREKQIKGGSTKDKEALIKTINPGWKDLWDDIQDLYNDMRLLRRCAPRKDVHFFMLSSAFKLLILSSCKNQYSSFQVHQLQAAGTSILLNKP